MAIAMMRGLVATLEKHHKVRILDEAVERRGPLSARYIPARQLPDKAVSLLDTACARVAMSQNAIPAPIEDCRRRIDLIDTELKILERETAAGADQATPARRVDGEDLRSHRRAWPSWRSAGKPRRSSSTQDPRLRAKIEAATRRPQAPEDGAAQQRRPAAAQAELDGPVDATARAARRGAADAGPTSTARRSPRSSPAGPASRSARWSATRSRPCSSCSQARWSAVSSARAHALEAIAPGIRTGAGQPDRPAPADRRLPARRPLAASARPRPPSPWPSSSTAASETLTTINMSEYKEEHKVSAC